MKAKFTAWVILNKYGSLWTKDIFDCQTEAQAHAARFWGTNLESLNTLRYKQANITVRIENENSL